PPSPQPSRPGEGDPFGRLKHGLLISSFAISSRGFLIVFALLVSLLVQAGQGATYDLIIRNGRVVDGTGNPAFFADVAVADGKVAGIRRIRGRGRVEIDATGM